MNHGLKIIEVRATNVRGNEDAGPRVGRRSIRRKSAENTSEGERCQKKRLPRMPRFAANASVLAGRTNKAVEQTARVTNQRSISAGKLHGASLHKYVILEIGFRVTSTSDLFRQKKSPGLVAGIAQILSSE